MDTEEFATNCLNCDEPLWMDGRKFCSKSCVNTYRILNQREWCTTRCAYCRIRIPNKNKHLKIDKFCSGECKAKFDIRETKRASRELNKLMEKWKCASH